ncbi:hypothetical protein Rsub_12907 [Raphidocelis subcapitata]|uniref:Reverse transcriptase domain-containing protein n=1 Tax=Raphidocelis subcapitata TaxID=307507 RepID=A0A2V0PK37_9CHLO|nr:hypothetical protein Rsub_12907 [Raphidocelis subcapitata]|eukprot:GBG00087.1 hypothetical protein Rsub_12907 [Raphidocelis subcapitata]
MPLPPRLRFDEERREEYVAALCDAGVQQRLATLASLDGPAAAAALASVVREAATAAFGRPQSRRAPAAGGARQRPRDAPWFARCRRAHFNLQDALHRSLDPDAARRWRNAFNAQKRREQRRLRARGNAAMLEALRHQPRRFWSDYKSEGAAAVGGHSPAEVRAHWQQQFGGLGRGSLLELATALRARNPQELAARLAAEAAASDAGARPEALRRRQAAAALNTPIREQEVLDQLRRCSFGAAAGLDGLGADLLKGAFRWIEGSEADLGNYRPIQNMCAVSKLYHMVLLARLDGFAEAHGLRAAGQAGFRAGRRAADNVYVLRHLIDRARLTQRRAAPQRRPLFVCFVDFEKAYDSVPRDALFRYLAEIGLAGDMLATLAGIYWRVRVRAKAGAALCAPFDSTCGVRQGDPLSPLLFGLYIDRVEAWLAERTPDTGVELVGSGGRLRVLLYADDLALLASDAEGLQAQLDALQSFCNTHHLRVNVSKTEVVVFGLKCTAARWTYRGARVPTSPEFKYLGVTLHSTKGTTPEAHQRKAAGLRAAFALLARCKQRGIADFSLRCRLFRILVEPTLNYCAEVWAPDLMRTVDAALAATPQVVQNDFLRQLGGLRRNIPVSILTAEACTQPLARAWLRACTAHWNRLMRAPADSALKRAFAGDLELARDRPPRASWAGSWLSTLGHVAAAGSTQLIHPEPGAELPSYLAGLRTQMRHATTHGTGALLSLNVPLDLPQVWGAWDAALAHRTQAPGRSSGATAAAYAQHFKVHRAAPDCDKEPGFPEKMPFYFRHTSAFNGVDTVTTGLVVSTTTMVTNSSLETPNELVTVFLIWVEPSGKM